MQKFENQPISGVTSMAASQYCLEILLILVTKMYKYTFFIIWAHVMCNYLLSWDCQKKYSLQTQISHTKDLQPNKNSPENIALPKFYIIVGIGVSTPPLFFAKPPPETKKLSKPPPQAISPYILVFQEPPLKVGSFSEPQKY